VENFEEARLYGKPSFLSIAKRLLNGITKFKKISRLPAFKAKADSSNRRQRTRAAARLDISNNLSHAV
jgi:hypothetical protein